jgi:hypothetical protein
VDLLRVDAAGFGCRSEERRLTPGSRTVVEIVSSRTFQPWKTGSRYIDIKPFDIYA